MPPPPRCPAPRWGWAARRPLAAESARAMARARRTRGRRPYRVGADTAGTPPPPVVRRGGRSQLEAATLGGSTRGPCPPASARTSAPAPPW
eukprot:1523857-Pleurochrysis_carterae.AAC.2